MANARFDQLPGATSLADSDLLAGQQGTGTGGLKGLALSLLKQYTLIKNQLSELSTLQLVGIGDSITFGTGATSIATCYFTLLAQLLGLTANNLGVSGKTAGTYDLSLIPTYDASVHKYILFEFGTNDVNFGDSLATFTTNYTAMIANAHGKGWPYAQMFFLSIPGVFNNGSDSAPTPTAITFNTEMATFATSVGATYIDLFTTLRNAYYAPIKTIASDANHPNNRGHKLIAATCDQIILPIYTVTTQGLVLNKLAEFYQLKIREFPVLMDGYILGTDNFGNVGVMPFLPPNTQAKGTFTLSANLIQEGAILPTGYDPIKDILLVFDSRLVCAGNNVGDKTTWEPFSSATGGMNYRHYSGSGTFKWFGGLGVTGAQNELMSLDVATGLMTFNFSINVISSTRGSLPCPRMTTSQKNAIVSPPEGSEVYDLTLHKKCVFTGTVWETITSV